MANMKDELDQMLRSFSTGRLLRMADRSDRNAKILKDKADRIRNLAYDLARERGEHMGDDPPGRVDMRGVFPKSKYTY